MRRGAFEDMHDKFTYNGARQETETALFVSIEKLLAKAGIKPGQVLTDAPFMTLFTVLDNCITPCMPFLLLHVYVSAHITESDPIKGGEDC